MKIDSKKDLNMSQVNSRKDFIKKAGFASLGFIGMGASSSKDEFAIQNPFQTDYEQVFNMSGYAAPPIETVRVGVIGLGGRGTGTTARLTRIEGAEIKALCDLQQEAAEAALERINRDSPVSHEPDIYAGSEDIWMEMCERDDIDLVIINTPWDLHAPMAIYAMEQGKHVVTEVPIATTIEDCWELVKTSERTRQHCMMLSNPCYRDFDMMALGMARDGYFGEIIHAEGAYIHDLRHLNFSKDQYQNMWRLRQNATRNGNLYPTHGLGTICNIMDINCGDQMSHLVSVSSNDFMMGEMAKELAAEDPFFEEFTDKEFRGNINSTIIRTHNGRTILLQHDVTSPRPGIRFNLVSGTDGVAQARPPRVAKNHDGWLPDEEYATLEEKYTPEISKQVGDLARQVGGHGGMDTMMLWRLIDCLRNGIPLDMSVYDGVLWSAMAPLSEWSVANGSKPVAIPDFTSGSWQTNERGMDIELQRGATTQII